MEFQNNLTVCILCYNKVDVKTAKKTLGLPYKLCERCYNRTSILKNNAVIREVNKATFDYELVELLEDKERMNREEKNIGHLIKLVFGVIFLLLTFIIAFIFSIKATF